MDQKFKKIIQKTKAWNQGIEPLSQTFEGALFQDSSWPFLFDDSVRVEDSFPMKSEAAVKLISDIPEALSLVLFVGDSFVDGPGEDLLGKMIQAMKLRSGEFNRVIFDEALENINDLSENLATPGPETLYLFNQIEKFKPQIVVSLGATVTNILLGKREKLSGIHGQFFEKSLNSESKKFTYHLMPIFHPDFLVINPNMKRTAWIDLQKVMERVGKI